MVKTEPVKWVGTRGGEQAEQRDGRRGQTLNLMGRDGLRGVHRVQGCSRTSEHVYTRRVYYNHLLQQKQALSFEPAAKKKPLLAPFHSERHIHSPTSFSHSRGVPATGWLRKTEQKTTRRQIGGVEKKVHIFSKPKAWERGSLPLGFSNEVGVVRHADPPLTERAKFATGICQASTCGWIC